MKKEYIEPEVEVIAIAMDNLLLTSPSFTVSDGTDSEEEMNP